MGNNSHIFINSIPYFFVHRITDVVDPTILVNLQESLVIARQTVFLSM